MNHLADMITRFIWHVLLINVCPDQDGRAEREGQKMSMWELLGLQPHSKVEKTVVVADEWSHRISTLKHPNNLLARATRTQDEELNLGTTCASPRLEP